MLIDGKPGDCLPASDRGLQYGDGLFETIAWIGSGPCLWDRHMGRLEEGASRLGIPSPGRGRLLREAREVVGCSPRAVLKIILTRGSGGRGYRPPEVVEPRRILAAYPWPSYPDAWTAEGVLARWCRTPLGANPALAGLKHLNRLEQVLGSAEWSDPRIGEGIMCDLDGWVIGGTMTNLFLVSAGRLMTPRVDRGGVAGVMRGLVIEVARGLGIAVAEERLKPRDLRDFEAAFVTNSLIGLWPLRNLGDIAFHTQRIPSALVAEVRSRAFTQESPDPGQQHTGET